MAVIAPAYATVSPSFIEPEMVISYNQASGAFDLIPGSEPRVRLGPGDLAVYARRLDLRTRVQAGQSASNNLPSVTIVNTLMGTATYLLRVRTEYDHHDQAAASNWGYSLPEAMRLGMRQGQFQLARNALLYGLNPANGEGLLGTQGATAVTLPADSFNNTQISTYDAGQLAFFFNQQVGLLKTRTMQLGMGRKIAIVMPQRIGQQIEYANIVQLTQFQRTGAGSATTAGVVKMTGMMNGDTITWGYDDTLIGKGAGGTDAIIMVLPEVQRPTRDGINTNTFASLAPGITATTMMYADMSAPREIPAPLPAGTVDITSEWRISSGWAIRPEAVTIISAPY
jgi:hypothetical protein